MKRNAFVSALALIAVIGGTSVAVAQAKGPQQGMGQQGQMQAGQMQAGQMQAGQKQGCELRAGMMRENMMQGAGMGGMPFGPAFDFATVDTDGDGKITQDEIDAMKAARFAEIDADGNGTVDADELFAHQEAQRIERQKARASQMLASRDTDGDGVLSQSELQHQPRMSMFDRLDADNDGALSEEELAAARQHRMQQPGTMRGGKMGMNGDMQARQMGGRMGDCDRMQGYHAGKAGYGQMQGQMKGQMQGQMNGQMPPVADDAN